MPHLHRAALQGELVTWILAWHRGHAAADDSDGARFESLALRLFSFQFEHIADYRAFCEHRGANPATVQCVADIPLLPVTAFKTAPACTAEAAARPAYTFHTSGTSDGRPGIVHLRDTALYDASLQIAFARFAVPDDASGTDQPLRFRCLSLVPSSAQRPHSSLGYMVRRLAQRWDDGHGSQHGEDDGGFTQALDRAAHDGRPVLVFATSLGLARWLAGLAPAWSTRLPRGSRLMDTGGSKGRHSEIDRGRQHAELVQRLGLDPGLIFGEYGMTELASQRYEPSVRATLGGESGVERAYLGPPWLRTRVLRPSDHGECAPGETGMLAHLDLCNLDHCAFLLTADLGRTVPIGERVGIELCGRVPGSEWRGCGLEAE
jgi:hypothetical protein